MLLNSRLDLQDHKRYLIGNASELQTDLQEMYEFDRKREMPVVHVRYRSDHSISLSGSTGISFLQRFIVHFSP